MRAYDDFLKCFVRAKIFRYHSAFHSCLRRKGSYLHGRQSLHNRVLSPKLRYQKTENLTQYLSVLCSKLDFKIGDSGFLNGEKLTFPWTRLRQAVFLWSGFWKPQTVDIVVQISIQCDSSLALHGCQEFSRDRLVHN